MVLNIIAKYRDTDLVIFARASHGYPPAWRSYWLWWDEQNDRDRYLLHLRRLRADIDRFKEQNDRKKAWTK